MKLVSEFHRKKGIEARSMSAHSAVHVIVQNQIALGEEVVTETEERLLREKLDRHEIVHAIGAILTEQIHDTLTSNIKCSQGEYASRLKTLSANRWKK